MTADNLKAIKEALYIFAHKESEAIERAIANSPKPPESLYQKCDEMVADLLKEQKRRLPIKKAITILVAAALLLTSCAIVYRDEIRGFIEEVTEHFTKLSHSDEATSGGAIEEIYEFTYVPEGYVLEESNVNPLLNKNVYRNSDGNIITIRQRVLSSNGFFVDNDEQILILTVDAHDIYYTLSEGYHAYLWNDGEYAMAITSDTKLLEGELLLMVKGVKKE